MTCRLNIFFEYDGDVYIFRQQWVKYLDWLADNPDEDACLHFEMAQVGTDTADSIDVDADITLHIDSLPGAWYKLLVTIYEPARRKRYYI